MISVIVPIYRCRKYLDRAIQSILAQTFPDFEVILVDDGSADGTVELAREYEKRDSRIRVIVQEHAGVSAARNLAMEFVRGDYILFMDGDDYIEPCLLENLISAASDDCDPGCVSYVTRSIIGETGRIRRVARISCSKYHALETGEQLVRHISRNEGACYGVCGHMFRKKIIMENRLKFQEKMFLGEDTLFFWEYLMCCKGVFMVNYVGYNYIVHSDSLTTSERHIWKDDIPQRLLLCRHLCEFVAGNRKSEFNSFLAHNAWLTLNQICGAWNNTGDTESLKQCVKTKAVKESVYSVILKYAPLRRKILTLIFMVSPSLFRICLKSFT